MLSQRRIAPNREPYLCFVSSSNLVVISSAFLLKAFPVPLALTDTVLEIN